MTRSISSAFFLVALVLLAIAPRFARAAESYDNCTGTITSLPAVITTQGTWCVKQDLATAITTGSAITINTNNVTLDCNNFKVGGLGAGLGTTTFGIFSTNRFNITVRHCNVRGFYVGIVMGDTTGSSAGGHLIEDNRLDGNTSIGIVVGGDGSAIQHNRVFDTGGATAGTDASGIASQGSVDILDNTVSGVVATASSSGWAYGINAQSNIGGSINGNRVRGLIKDGTFEYGISASGTQLNVRDNDLVGSGVVGSIGVACSSATDGARDNQVNHFDTTIATCTDNGGNGIVP